MKKAAVALVVIIVMAIGWLGWQKHQASEEMDRALAFIRKASALLTQQSSMEHGDAGATASEYFTKSNLAVDELDKELLDIRSAEWSHRPEAKDIAVEFLSKVREGIKFSADLVRVRTLADNAQAMANAATAEASASDSAYIKQLAYAKAQQSLQDGLVQLEKLRDQGKDIQKHVSALIEADQKVKQFFGSGQGIEPTVLERLPKA